MRKRTPAYATDMIKIRLSVEATAGARYRPSRQRLNRTARMVFESEPRRVRSLAGILPLLVGCSFLSDTAMRKLNRRWFGRDSDTDVISFNFNEARPDGWFLGEIFISSGVLLRQASEADHSADDEADLLLIHGCLHLLGFDHTLPGRQGRLMTLKQDRLFRRRALRG